MMLKILTIYLVVLFAFVNLGCGRNRASSDANKTGDNQSRTSKLNAAPDDRPNTADNQNVVKPDDVLDTRSTKSLQIDKYTFVGCWSAGDSRNTVVEISKTSILTSNSRKPLAYELVLANWEENLYVLKLKESDETNELQPFVSLEMPSQDEMILKDYNTYQDWVERDANGRIRLFRDDCKNVCRSLKRKS